MPRREADYEDDYDEASDRPRGKKDILGSKRYKNFRDGRALSAVLVFFGVLCTLSCAVLTFAPPEEAAGNPPLPPAAAAAGMALGAAGLVGGVAAIAGSRQLAYVGYLFAIPLLLAIPFGTIVSIFWMLGLSRYQDALDMIRQDRDLSAE